jgi:hypothetical protein
MDNQETLATLGTQDTGRRQTKIQHNIENKRDGKTTVRENHRTNPECTTKRHW